MTQTWIFFRGLGREVEHWGEFRELFMQKFPDDHALFIDLPGTGAHTFARAPYSIRETMEWVRAKAAQSVPTLSELNIIGVSMGGMIAMDWAVQHPNEINHLVLINSSCRESGRVWQRLRWHTVVYLLLGLIPFCRLWVERKMLLVVMNHAHKVEKIWRLWKHLAEITPTPASTVMAQLVAAGKFRLPAEVPRVQCVVISSAHDRLVRSENSAFLQRKWSGKSAIHPTAGHDLPADDSEWLLSQLSLIRDARTVMMSK